MKSKIENSNCQLTYIKTSPFNIYYLCLYHDGFMHYEVVHLWLSLYGFHNYSLIMFFKLPPLVPASAKPLPGVLF
jgi:hypothetical protein